VIYHADVVKDPKEEFEALYQAYDRSALTQVGRAHLDGNLKLRARHYSRRFWVGFGICVIIAVWLTVLCIIYVLERATVSAATFEHHRQERMDKLEAGG
jgi:hypothetical protein